MNLTETSAPVAAYPVRALADHVRLSTGFADDGAQDGLLEACLRAAMAAIEARTGKIVFSRTYGWEIARWFAAGRQGLPVAPVSAVTEVVLVARDGMETLVAPERYWLRRDTLRSELLGAPLPAIPTGGTVRIGFIAGFGPEWGDAPADLRQAVLMLAAHYLEHRGHGAGDTAAMPFGVQALIERFRTVRLLGDRL